MLEVRLGSDCGMKGVIFMGLEENSWVSRVIIRVAGSRPIRG